MIHTQAHRQTLQLAMPVLHANGADVIAFGEEQLDDHFAIFTQARRIGANLHPLAHGGDTGGLQLVGATHLNQTQPARSNGRDTFEVTQCRDGDTRFPRRLQDRLLLISADELAVDAQCLDRHAKPSRKDEVRARSVSKISHHPCLRCGLGQTSSFILHPFTSRLSYSLRKNRRVLSSGFGAA